ncbi:MAG TPA: glycosyltransferase family A protein [Flavipsychrobacter sp.]|nr:glycosyltransferase family A protein [Flavipsychrobacter sp.]
MKVSIVMCCYNEEKFIDRAIQCVLQQTYTDWELIVSDDCSSDNTVACVEKYLGDERIRLVRNKTNLGCQRNKNLASLLAKGEVITQLDADDTCTPDRIQRQVTVLTQHPEIKICGSNYCILDQQEKRLYEKMYAADFLVTDFENEYPFWFPGLMYKTELIEEFGLLPEYFVGSHGEDHYWTIRVNKKYPIYFIKDVLYFYYINPGSVTNLLTNPRKLIVEELIKKLIEQQKDTGTDWLQEGKPEMAREFEQQLMADRPLMAEKYRIWAAKALDNGDTSRAAFLLRESFARKKTNVDFYRTVWYYIRKRLSGSQQITTIRR